MLNGFAYCRMIYKNGKPQDFTYMAVNHAFCDLIGLHDVEGKNVSEVIPDIREADPCLFEIYGRVASTGIPERFEMFVKSLQDWFSVSVYSPRQGDFVSVLDVITERRRAEAALRESEQKFRTLFESMETGVFYQAADGTLEDVNSSALRMLGLTREQFLGRDSYDPRWKVVAEDGTLLPAKQHPSMIALQTGKAVTHRIFGVYNPVRDDYTWLNINAEPQFRAGEPAPFKVYVTMDDITGRKLAEEAREALLKELEQKNAELERFTYTVSHDLKSPLITIRGFIGLLREDALKGDTLQMDRDIIRITSATEKMQELLSDLLSLSRVGRITSPPEQIYFGKIAQEARELLEETIRENGVTVTIAPDLPDVFVDPIRIREVLTNLIENAIKFRGAQGPVVEIGVIHTTERPVFYVRDNGMGIEPEYLTRIFGLFEKLDPKSEGTGIGLAIVKRIIEVHGGKIWVESPGPGQGTTFWFTLPPGGNRC